RSLRGHQDALADAADLKLNFRDRQTSGGGHDVALLRKRTESGDLDSQGVCARRHRTKEEFTRLIGHAGAVFTVQFRYQFHRRVRHQVAAWIGYYTAHGTRGALLRESHHREQKPDRKQAVESLHGASPLKLFWHPANPQACL